MCGARVISRLSLIVNIPDEIIIPTGIRAHRSEQSDGGTFGETEILYSNVPRVFGLKKRTGFGYVRTPPVSSVREAVGKPSAPFSAFDPGRDVVNLRVRDTRPLTRRSRQNTGDAPPPPARPHRQRPHATVRPVVFTRPVITQK